VERTDDVEAHVPFCGLVLSFRYIDSLYDQMRKAYKHVTRINLINMVFTVCRLLEGYLDTTISLSAEIVEAIFAQCVMWGFGGALILDKNADHRRNFNDIFTAMTGTIKYPKEGKDSLCFDYYLDIASGELKPWTTKVCEGGTPCVCVWVVLPRTVFALWLGLLPCASRH
jgi:hypothetical protein